MNVQTFLLYVATWTAVAITPGPAVMFVMAQSTRYSFRSGLAGVLGIQLGNAVFFVCAACGLGAVLAAATTVFTVLRVIGALYLFYVGLRIIVQSFRRRNEAGPTRLVANRASKTIFGQGVLVQVTNPKALLFVSALLPQFIDSRSEAAPQFLLLAVATIAVDLVVLSTYAFLAQGGRRFFEASPVARWLERVLGVALLCFGGRLLATRR